MADSGASFFCCILQGLSLFLERIFLAVPESLSSVHFSFDFLLLFSKPLRHVFAGSGCIAYSWLSSLRNNLWRLLPFS